MAPVFLRNSSKYLRLKKAASKWRQGLSTGAVDVTAQDLGNTLSREAEKPFIHSAAAGPVALHYLSLPLMVSTIAFPEMP